MQSIIIDDKKGAKDTLKLLLKIHCPEISIIAEASNVAEGLEVISTYNPRLVFLDIEMPDGTGFDLLEQIETVDFKIIFTTGFEQYAIKAFKFSAIDYLLKPIDADDLKEAVAKAQAEVKNKTLQLKVGTLLSNLQEVSDALKKIVLKDSDTVHVVQVKDILYLEADSNYTKFYLTDNREILTSNTLKEYDTILSKTGFYRVHKSFLVNLSMVEKFDKREGGTIILQGNIQLPIAYRKKDEFLSLLEMI